MDLVRVVHFRREILDAVERVRPMDDEARVDRTLVGFLRIDRRTEVLDGW